MKAIKAGLTRLEDKIGELSLRVSSRTQDEMRRTLLHDGKDIVVQRKQADASSRQLLSRKQEPICERCSRLPLDPEKLDRMAQRWRVSPEALDRNDMGRVFKIIGLAPDVCTMCWLIQET
jgi:hypothetical protein